MTRRRHLSEEERALWAGIACSVTPLRRAKAAKAAAKAAAAKSAALTAPQPEGRRDKAGQRTKAREQAATARPKAETARQTTPPTPPAPPAPPGLAPLGRRLRQRVARGRETIDARLDLHGHTQAEAHAALLRFLQRARSGGARIVLVVTGKGSPRRDADPVGERGVLRRRVPLWLALPEFRALVVGFEDAHVSHGGEGALYLRLRRGR